MKQEFNKETKIPKYQIDILKIKNLVIQVKTSLGNLTYGMNQVDDIMPSRSDKIEHSNINKDK